MDAELSARAEALSSALAKLPDHRGIVYRGTDLSPPEISAYEPGAVVAERGFTSTTKDAAQAVSGNACFVVLSARGKDISSFSALPEEQEVTFDHDTDFLVITRVVDRELGVTFIGLAERVTDQVLIPRAAIDAMAAEIETALAALQEHLRGSGVPAPRASPSKFDGAIGGTNEQTVLVTSRFLVEPASS